MNQNTHKSVSLVLGFDPRKVVQDALAKGTLQTDKQILVSAKPPIGKRNSLFAKVPIHQLTPRQLEVFLLLEKGLGLREIGRQLNISHVAIIKHRKSILRHLNNHSSD